jgi:PAS domain S-box-containing protein
MIEELPPRPPRASTPPDVLNIPRTRFALWLILASMVIPIISVIYRKGTSASLPASIIPTVVVVALLLRLSRGDDHSRNETMAALIALCGASALVGITSGDTTTAMLLLVLICMVSATLVPWGLQSQLITVGIAAFGLISVIVVVESSLGDFGYGMLTSVTFAFAVSVYIAYELERTRNRAVDDEHERQRAADALRLVESAIEQANDAVLVMTAEHELTGPRVVFVNPAFTKLTGFTTEDAAGRSLRAVFPPAEESYAINSLYTAIREARPAIGEGTFRRRDASVYMVEWHIAPVRNATGAITNWVAIVRDTTERTRAEQARAALLEVARSISGELDLDQILGNVQRQIATLLPCDRVATFLWDGTTQTLSIAASQGFTGGGPFEEALASRYQPGEQLRDHWLKGNSIVIEPPRSPAWIPKDVLLRLGISAALATPLHARGRMVGVLLAANAEGRPRFERGQVQLFEGIAHQVALAIDAAELFQAQREDAEVSSALARVGREMISSLSMPVLLGRLCQLTTEMLACDCSHTFLWHPDEDAYLPASGHGDEPDAWERFRLQAIRPADFPGMLACLRRDEAVQLILRPDTPADPGTTRFSEAGLASSLCVALRRGKDVIGFHIAHYREDSRPFSREQERVIRGIGHLASMALENARLVEELERANRVKSDFVATMSHELRTPLNVIIGYNELLLSGSFGDLSEEQSEPLQRADRNAKELLELIDATLDLSRLEQQNLPLSIVEIDIAPLIEEVARETAGIAEKPAVELRCELSAELPVVHSDPVKLRMVLKNLLTNAFKFTAEGSVTVSAISLDGGVEVAVADTGIGMTQESQKVIFEPFRQIDSSDTRRYRGAGLGLHIVDRLLKALGGTVSVTSELGEGSTFRVWLPCDADEAGLGQVVSLLAHERRWPGDV